MLYIIPASAPPKIMNRMIPMAAMMRLAFAQLDLLGLVLLLNAHTNSMMRFTSGINMIIMVMIQLPRVTDGWIFVVVTSLSIVLLF